MPSDYGSLSWMARTNGRMSPMEQARELAVAVKAEAQRKLVAGCLIDANGLSVENVLPPDTQAVRTVQEFVSRIEPGFMLNHSIRAYYWARYLLADVKCDFEALYVAMLLHDVGLTDFVEKAQGVCFTHYSSEAARGLLEPAAWEAERILQVQESIVQHLNVLPGTDPLALMVRVGSGADVAGLGLDQIPTDLQREVLNRWPRLNFVEGFVQSLQAEAERCPEGRIEFMCSKLHFLARVRLVGSKGD
ncbi:MAG: HD domain-containing protein [Fimbriimonas sp.]